MRSKYFALLLLIFVLIGALGAQSTAELKINVLDKNRHIVSDAIVIANYQESIEGEVFDRQIRGVTGSGGAFDTTIYFTQNSTPANYIYLRVYHPYWSSKIFRLRIPKELDQPIIESTITFPFEFQTYRVRIDSQRGTDLSNASVQLMHPFFVSKEPQLNSMAQFRVPKGTLPYGRVEVGDQYQLFSFENSESNMLTVPYPFSNPKNISDPNKYSLSLEVLDSQNNALPNHPLIISTNYSNSTYFTDSNGNFIANDIPVQNITLHWHLHNYLYSRNFDLQSLDSNKLISDRLLTIHSPSILHLGESCYRVEVNITDPREGALKQVIARAVDSGDEVAIALEQNQTINQSLISFNRIFCVVEDTSFDIVASSPFENTSLTIKLLKAPPPKQQDPPELVSDPPFEGIPEYIREQQDEQRKLELLVILVELLVFLIAIYLGLKFRLYVVYYLRAILRFTYTYFEPFFRKKD